MASIETPPFHQLLTAGGGATGILTVTSTAGYKVGAVGWLCGPLASPESQFVRINSIIDATHVSVIFIPEGINDVKLRTGAVHFPSFHQSDCSAYPLGSSLDMPQQVVALPPTS
jgi:hypothetical protein